MRRALPAIAILLATTFGPAAAAAQCTEDAAYRALDFWVGEWDVRVGDASVGHNRIEKILDGCAIVEMWTASGGGTGRSLFYYVPAEGEWRQVWVTTSPAAPGGVKEKRQVGAPANAVRFQGTVTATDGRSWLDRTTLTANADGSVRQLIEISTDGGTSWRATFDALYVRVPG